MRKIISLLDKVKFFHFDVGMQNLKIEGLNINLMIDDSYKPFITESSNNTALKLDVFYENVCIATVNSDYLFVVDLEKNYFSINVTSKCSNTDCDRLYISKDFDQALLAIKPLNSHIPPFVFVLRRPWDTFLVANYLAAKRQGIIVHAAGVIYKNRAYLFSGESGSGKSTLARLFLADEECIVMGEENIILQSIGGKTIRAFSTPWSSGSIVVENISAELGGIYFIDHGTENIFCDIPSAKATKKIMDNVLLPKLLPQNLVSAIGFINWISANIMVQSYSFIPNKSSIGQFKSNVE